MAEGMSVKSSLRLAFASVLAGAFIVGAFSIVQMGRLNASTQTIYEREYTAGQATEQIRSFLLRASRAQTQLLTATTAGERDSLGKDVEAGLAQITQRMESIQKLDLGAESQTTEKQLTDALAVWAKRMKDYVQLVKEQPLDLMQMSPDVPSADARLLNDTRKLEKIVDTLVQQQGESAQATIASAAQIYRTSLAWVIGITLALIALSLLISEWVTLRLTRQLGGEPAYAKSIASAIAHGDLRMQIKLAKNDETSLLFSLHEMQSQLADTMGEIASRSNMVANASREISMGNLDLSQRTELQATSLEKTNASAAQVTAIAKRNAESAAHAAQLSAQATQAAMHGGEVLAQVVMTMDQIRKSTDAIHSNIGAIQSIAFQTNILALNAAVEAAHAGDQGRGFAVVAAEVRLLAQRSATAAKEISALIEDSAAHVKDGAALAGTAGATIAEMAQTVQQVSNVMGDVSGASREQSVGIEEINQAISDLDQSTQQNAALVEQAAAAAQSLDEQAQALDGLVGRFDLHPS
ncbi:methyl-accepting chemotaxis protein [Rhodoferax aquaticus]|uniref:Methyl-accepting chemotaxis protein n=2 Tax=Rhodoferax aquaticus TaxID=2527691 RepID=A0A515EVB8_9BURK|nr:methyl-accepting chemotaxis protein [Rhodoferax aquaticus]